VKGAFYKEAKMRFLDKLFGRKKPTPVLKSGKQAPITKTALRATAARTGTHAAVSKTAVPAMAAKPESPTPLTPSNEKMIRDLLAELTPDIAENMASEMSSDSYRAAEQLAALGETAVEPLVQMLPTSSRAHYALGLIGGETSFKALVRELNTGNWRRIQAAARALEWMKDKRALAPLRRHINTSIAEVFTAVTNAIAVIERDQIREEQLFKVDYDNPVGQVERFWTLLDEFRNDPIKREGFRQWHAEFVAAMPNLKFNSKKKRGWIWYILGVTIYKVINPDAGGFNRNCPEAAYCFEQAMKDPPDDISISYYLNGVTQSRE
jgi:hypothetical protein